MLHLRVVALWPVPLVVPHLLHPPTHTSTHVNTSRPQSLARWVTRQAPLSPPPPPHLQTDDVGAALPHHLGQVRHALHVPAPALPVGGGHATGSDPTTPSRQAWPAAAMMMMRHVLRLWVEVGGWVGVPDVVGHDTQAGGGGGSSRRRGGRERVLPAPRQKAAAATARAVSHRAPRRIGAAVTEERHGVVMVVVVVPA